ncbi:hypothetical protein [Streptodolium elevatio]
MSVVGDARKWAAADASTAEAAARAAAAHVPGMAFDGFQDGPVVEGCSWRRAFFVQAGRRYALVPAGSVQLGFDVEEFIPTPAQAAAHAEGADEYGYPADVREYLRGLGESAPGRLSAPREVRVPGMLVAVEAVPVDELIGDEGDDFDDAFDDDGDAAEGGDGAKALGRHVSAALAAFGARAITPDEWEYACGAGTGTLFRWGDSYPDVADPFSAPDGPQHEVNRFGLAIARDPYDCELTSEPGVLVGGDGGEATCGGYGAFLAWLPLASAYRLTPSAGAWGDHVADAVVRPVIDLAT